VRTYLLPDLSGYKRWVNNYHIKCLMQFFRNLLWLIEVIEYIARVLIELLIKL